MSVKFKIEKGRTIQRNGETWDREIYTLEMEVPETKDVENARIWAVKTIDGWLSGKKAEAPPIQTVAPKEKVVPTEDIRDLLHDLHPDLEEMLEFEETEDYIKIKPRRFLSTENFAKIASIVRDAGGEYVSAGSDSHFRFEKKPSEKPAVPPFDPEELIRRHRWKGRKAKYGEGYEDGSLAWGWDYTTEFSKEVIEILSKGPLSVDKYEFTLSENGKLVQTRKVKQ